MLNTEQRLQRLAARELPKRNPGPTSVLRSYMQLTKVGLNGLVVFTTFVGFVVASPEAPNAVRLVWTLAGTALAALGASAINQWIERRRDALMLRTRKRPLPSGRISAPAGLLAGLSLALGGDTLLFVLVNPLTAMLALIVQLTYLLIYTPLKVRTPLATFAGAVCGAIPPMMGYSAVTGGLPAGAWILGAVLFAWQIPHSLALAWLYREDYLRGGYRLLPILETNGRTTSHAVLLYTAALLPLALALVLAGQAGVVFAAGACVLGVLLLVSGYRLYLTRSEFEARRLFLASIAYLPLLLILLLLDSEPPARAAMPVPASPATIQTAEAGR